MQAEVEVAPSKPAEFRFNPSRLPATERSTALVEEIRNQLLNYECHRHPRGKRRRACDQARFDRIVTALVCELAHAALRDPASWRYISLSKRMTPEQATGATFMTAERIRIIRWMAEPEMDWLELTEGGLGFARNRQTAIRASERFRRYMDDHDIDYGDLGLDESLQRDPLVLRTVKVSGKAKNLPIPEGEPAATYRAEMHRINRWLANADIACDYDDKGNPRDEGDRRLSRIFNDGMLDQGGRLYGGFWLHMRGADRLADITLNGEPVAMLDYGQCGIRIAYGLVGAAPPSGDLYCVPGLERFREGVKKVLNAQLSRTSPMKRLPMNTREHFHRSLSAREIEALILQHHHAIREYFHGGLGLTLMFKESQVLVRCLLQLSDMNLLALPVHDGLLVPQSQVRAVVQVMKRCFEQITGVEAQVSVHGVALDGRPLSTSIDTYGLGEGEEGEGMNRNLPSPIEGRINSVSVVEPAS